VGTQEGERGVPHRRWPLYTWELTPLCEVPDETWAVIGPILFPEKVEREPPGEVYPWLYRLDEKRREEFVDYCVELDCWHEELEFAAYDLETATEFSYSSTIYEDAAPHYKRLALIYHSDNVDHRIYAYREKVFQLVSLFLGGGAGSNKPEDFRKIVKDALSRGGYGHVVTLLNSLEDHRKAPSVAAALKRRRQLVHALAIREWKTLQARRGVEEIVTGLGPIEAVQQLANLEALIKEGREEIERLCETLAKFRSRRSGSVLRERSSPYDGGDRRRRWGRVRARHSRDHGLGSKS
jgi:hypothetical protein